MIDLYTWTTPNGRKISIALQEFGLAHRVHEVNLDEGEQRRPEFLGISPNGKIPAIVDHDAGRSVFESGAILLHLAERTDRFWGDDRGETIEWLMWQMGGFGPMLGQAHHFLHYHPGKAPYAEKRYHDEALRLYGVLDRRLDGRDHIVGAYGIADMATWPWASRFERHRVDLGDFPNVRDWYLRCAAREAVQAGYDVPRRDFAIPMP